MKDTSGINTEDVDVSKLSAFAVYRQLIPGVKSYEDHKPKANKQKKKAKKEIDDNAAKTVVNKDGHKEQDKTAGAGNKKKKAVPTLVSVSNPVAVTKASVPSPAFKLPAANGNGSTSLTGKEKKKAKKVEKKMKRKSRALEEAITLPKTPEAKSNQPSKKKAPVSVEPEVPSKKKRIELQPATKTVTKTPQQSLSLSKGSDGASNGNRSQIAKADKIVNSQPAKPVKPVKPNANGNKSDIQIKTLINSDVVEDSEKHGQSLFEWMISPTSRNQFFSDYWEKKPLLVKHGSKYFKWLLSSELLDETLRNKKLYFGKNVDLTSYTDGVRETHNPEGRALPPVVWDFYSNGCSVRILNPQTYIKNMWRLNASLQELFGTFVGANVYLTPPDTQGFAPHYDDIEAFILQVEGKKHWKLYAPRSPDEELPRFSSGNFNEETDKLGKPILDVVLEEGDMMYFPRGTIHQAKAVDGQHSLHITVSCYQTNTFGDLLKEYLPMALEQAQLNSVKFRKGLPTDFLSFMGLAHSTSTNKSITKKRSEFRKTLGSLVEDLLKVPCDYAADQLGKKFMKDSLPPFINSGDKEKSVYGGGEFMVNGQVFNSCEINPDVEIKLMRKNCMRLLFEDNVVKIYYTLENSLEYHAEEPQVLEVPEEAVEGIKYLISRYPEYTKIQDLPIEDEILKLQTASDLWEKGLLLTKEPLEPTDANEMMLGESDNEEDEGEEEEIEIDDDDSNEELDSDAIMEDDSLDSFGESDEEEEEEASPPPRKKATKKTGK